MRFVVYYTALTLLTACSSIEARHLGWINRISGDDQLFIDGQSFEAIFKPLASRDCSKEVQLPDSVKSRNELIFEPPCIYDSGLPIIEIKRSDGAFLAVGDFQLAEKVAIRACDQNPLWTSKDVLGELSDYGKGGVSAKGQAFLQDGVWSFFEICEEHNS